MTSIEHLSTIDMTHPLLLRQQGFWRLEWLGRLWRGAPNKLMLYWKAKQDFIHRLKDCLQKLNIISYKLKLKDSLQIRRFEFQPELPYRRHYWKPKKENFEYSITGSVLPVFSLISVCFFYFILVCTPIYNLGSNFSNLRLMLPWIDLMKFFK